MYDLMYSYRYYVAKVIIILGNQNCYPLFLSYRFQF